ncbi:MAG: ABC transporter permease [Lachnospiraceae bacterium]|nr:ABC transporter permease [Lachnospiraceae bacterium]
MKKLYKQKQVNSLPIVSLVVIGIFVLNGLFGSLILPKDPTETDLVNKLLPPVFFGGTWNYPLGTDELGRDVLSRIIAGGRVSLIVAAAAIVVGGIVGTALGIIAGYYENLADTIITRLTDASLAFPSILLALLLSIGIGPGEKAAIIAIAFAMWAKYARTVRSEVLIIKTANYITQAKIMGAGDLRIITRHILPNIKDMIIVMVSLEVGMSIISEASLSFLGLSVVPPTPSWGQMIADGKNYFQNGWWVSVFPALITIITVLSFQRFGNWLKVSKGGKA